MEDAKIDAIAREVLTSLKKARADAVAPSPSVEAPSRRAALPIHPSEQLLSVAGGVVGAPCIVEPDKACVGSLRCRTFGH